MHCKSCAKTFQQEQTIGICAGIVEKIYLIYIIEAIYFSNFTIWNGYEARAF